MPWKALTRTLFDDLAQAQIDRRVVGQGHGGGQESPLTIVPKRCFNGAVELVAQSTARLALDQQFPLSKTETVDDLEFGVARVEQLPHMGRVRMPKRMGNGVAGYAEAIAIAIATQGIVSPFGAHPPDLRPVAGVADEAMEPTVDPSLFDMLLVRPCQLPDAVAPNEQRVAGAAEANPVLPHRCLGRDGGENPLSIFRKMPKSGAGRPGGKASRGELQALTSSQDENHKESLHRGRDQAQSLIRKGLSPAGPAAAKVALRCRACRDSAPLAISVRWKCNA